MFASFPERLDAEADGYIALADCNEIGQRKRLFFGGRWWRVVVADCLAQDTTPAPEWLVDVDYRIWWQAYPHRALGLHRAMVCGHPSPPRLRGGAGGDEKDGLGGGVGKMYQEWHGVNRIQGGLTGAGRKLGHGLGEGDDVGVVEIVGRGDLASGGEDGGDGEAEGAGEHFFC